MRCCALNGAALSKIAKQAASGKPFGDMPRHAVAVDKSYEKNGEYKALGLVKGGKPFSARRICAYRIWAGIPLL